MYTLLKGKHDEYSVRILKNSWTSRNHRIIVSCCNYSVLNEISANLNRHVPQVVLSKIVNLAPFNEISSSPSEIQHVTVLKPPKLVDEKIFAKNDRNEDENGNRKDWTINTEKILITNTDLSKTIETVDVVEKSGHSPKEQIDDDNRMAYLNPVSTLDNPDAVSNQSPVHTTDIFEASTEGNIDGFIMNKETETIQGQEEILFGENTNPFTNVAEFDIPLHTSMSPRYDIPLEEAVIEITTEVDEESNLDQSNNYSFESRLYSSSALCTKINELLDNSKENKRSELMTNGRRSNSPSLKDTTAPDKNDSIHEHLQKPNHFHSMSFLAGDDDEEWLPSAVEYEMTPLSEKMLDFNDNTETDRSIISSLEPENLRAQTPKKCSVLSPYLQQHACKTLNADISLPDLSNDDLTSDDFQTMGSSVSSSMDNYGAYDENDDDSTADADYLPSDISEDSEENNSSSKRESTGSKTSLLKSADNSMNNSRTLNISGKAAIGSRDDTDMVVQTSDQKKSCKKYFCIYCKKLYSKLVRHLEQVHKNEDDVKKLAVLRKGSEERRQVIDILRKTGTFQFNTNPNYNSGELITSRRPNRKYDKKGSDYKTCPKCLGTYSILNIRHHVARCDPKRKKSERSILVLGRAVEGRLHKEASVKLRLEVFPPLREDDIVRLIRYDRLLIIWGNKLCLRYTPHYQHDMIRARLRLAGRLLLIARSINADATDFASLYTPKMYDDVVKAVRQVARFNEQRGEFAAPAVGMNLGTYIRQIGEILVNEYVKADDTINERKVEQFLKILKVDFATDVNKLALESQRKQQREKKVVLPSIDDIKTMTSYLNREMKESFKKLSGEKFSYKDWLMLTELTVASLVTFNRKRVGDIQNIEIARYMAKQRIDETTDQALYKTLTPESRTIANRYARITIRGKKGRTVPLLLFPQLEENIDLILKKRKDAGVPDTNEYLFGLPSYNSKRIRVVDGCAAMRKFSQLSGANIPSTLRGTELRKHIATHCVILNISDTEVSDLANFMGHAENIHKEIYRQPVQSRDILGVSRLLEAAQGQDEFSDDSDEGDITNTNDDPTANPSTNVRMNFKFADPGKQSNISTELLGEEQLIMNTRVNTSVDSDEQCNTTSIENEQSDLDSISHEKSPTPLENTAKRPSQHIIQYPAKRNKKTIKQKTTRENGKCKKRWEVQEKTIIMNAFSQHMANGKLPGFDEIAQVKARYSSILENRTLPQIKTWIHNQNKLKHKM